MNKLRARESEYSVLRGDNDFGVFYYFCVHHIEVDINNSTESDGDSANERAINYI